MKYKMVLLGILLAPIFMNSQNNNSEKQLEQVIEDFRTSIITHSDFENLEICFSRFNNLVSNFHW